MAAGLVLLAASQPPDAPRLSPGRAIEREIQPGGRLSFRVRAGRGQYVRLAVDQDGIDLAVSVFARDGARIADIDGFEYGRESASFVSEAGGTYRVEVRALPSAASVGRFGLALSPLAEPTEPDRRRMRAERLSTESKRLMSTGARASLAEAFVRDEEASGLWRAAGESFPAAAMLIDSGEILFRLNRYDEARERYRSARELSRATGNRRAEADASNDLGLCELQLGNIEEAVAALRDALSLWNALKFPYGAGVSRNNLGLLYWQTGEWQQALDEYLEALPLFPEASRRERALLLNNLGLAYISLGDFSSAIRYLSQAPPLFDAAKDPLAEGKALMNLGRAQMFSGNAAAALGYHREALGLIERAGDRRALADVWNNIGQVHARTREDTACRSELQRALSIYEDLHDSRGQGSALHHLGVLEETTGDLKTAARLLVRAIDFRLSSHLQDDAADTAYHLARVYGRLSSPAESRRHIEQAIGISESLRTKAGGELYRAYYFALKRDFYEFYIDLLMQSHRRDPSNSDDRTAFAAAERTRARSLLDRLAEGERPLSAAPRPALLAERERLRRRLALASYKLSELAGFNRDAARQQALKQELEGLLTSYRELEVRIRGDNPGYAELARADTLSAREVQEKLLDRGTMLAEFFLGTERSYLWLVTPNSFCSYALPARGEIEGPARELRDLLGNGWGDLSRPERGRQLRAAAANLGRRLFQGVGARLAGRRLAVVADGILQYIPFAVLPSTDGAVLGDEFEIVSLPSASAIAAMRRAGARKPAPRTLAILADPVFSAQDPRVRGKLPAGAIKPGDSAGMDLPRLPFSRHLAASLGAMLPQPEFLAALDFDASKEEFESGDLAAFSIVHLAAHTLIDDARPELSGLVLSQFRPDGRPVDGFVRLFEIYDNLRLPSAQLVVLGGCRTALGKEITGEGLLSLARGLMYAGAPRIVVTLWEVEDDATSAFMLRFYSALIGEKLKPAAALAKARREMAGVERWRDPYFHAAFALIGEWR